VTFWPEEELISNSTHLQSSSCFQSSPPASQRFHSQFAAAAKIFGTSGFASIPTAATHLRSVRQKESVFSGSESGGSRTAAGLWIVHL
jgi:hypothetical protein